MRNNCLNFYGIIKNCFFSCIHKIYNNQPEKKDDDQINPDNIKSDDKIEIIIDKFDNDSNRNENVDEAFEIIDESELEE